MRVVAVSLGLLGSALLPTVAGAGLTVEPGTAALAYAAPLSRLPDTEALQAIQAVTAEAFFPMAPEPAALPERLIADRVFSVVAEIPKEPVIAKADLECLSTAVYFEARGESQSGQAAVAQVILNRVESGAFPDSVCGVVYEGKNRKGGCQFSFACDGKADRIREKRAWTVAQTIAHEALAGRGRLAEVGMATHYHATSVTPRWARKMLRMTRIGRHIFYAEQGPRLRIAQNG